MKRPKMRTKATARREFMDALLKAMDRYYAHREVFRPEDVEFVVAGALTARFGQAYVIKKVQP